MDFPTAPVIVGVLILLSFLLAAPGVGALYAMRRDFSRRQMNPSIVEGLERSMVSNQRRMDETLECMDQLEAGRRDDRAKLIQLQTEIGRVGIRLDRWMAYAQRLVEIMRESNIPVPPSPDEMDEMAVQALAHTRTEDTSYDQGTLLRRMENAFDMTELHDLAFQLNIDIDQLTGETFNAQARSLIGIMVRRERLPELVSLCRTLRPKGRF